MKTKLKTRRKKNLRGNPIKARYLQYVFGIDYHTVMFFFSMPRFKGKRAFRVRLRSRYKDLSPFFELD